MARTSWGRLNRRANGSRKQRTPALFLEVLESRDVPTGNFYPQYVLLPQCGGANPFGSPGPTGYTPSQIRHAYGFDQIAFNGTPGDGRGTTIAIVDAYDDPNIAGDLHNFDVAFGLPDPSFTKVNQSGGSTMPAVNTGWDSEIALDVEWAHAVAPGANILLVEANDSSYTNLMAAVQYAAKQSGVVAVSMSWGGGEFSGETSYDSAFQTPAGHNGVTFVASSGDSGAPASYPAASPNVLSVGGTTLYLTSSNTISSESAWSGSGGGLSSVEAQPAYQKGIVTQSSTARGTPDVAYDADPYTGFPVYDTMNNTASAPWSQFGGTSDAAPQWAALIAIADQGRIAAGLGTLDGPSQTLPKLYALATTDFNDTTSGSSTGSPAEAAGTGYDLATGLGTPIANKLVADLVGQTTTSPAATHFSVTASTSTPTSGTAFTVTVTALDANGNTVTGYTGTVHFSSTDAAAALPADYTFTSTDAGKHTFTVTLVTSGAQSVTVTDKATSTVSGSAGVTVVGTTGSGTGTLVEGFETSDTWTVVGANTPSASRTTTAAHDGAWGLDDKNGNDWIYRTDAAAQLKAGDTVSVWLKFAGTANGQAYFGFGSTSTGTLALVASPSNNQLILERVSGYKTYTTLASVRQTYSANQWYRLEVDWGTSGKIVAKLFGSNGTTLLNSVTATTTAIMAGGFGFRAAGNDKYWDTVTANYGVNGFTAAPPATLDQWQALIALAQAEGWTQLQNALWTAAGNAPQSWWTKLGQG